jgi:hypothetical protein
VDGELTAYAPGHPLLSFGRGSFAGAAALVAGGVQDHTLVTAVPTELLVASRRELRFVVDVAPSVGFELAKHILPAFEGGVERQSAEGAA